MAGIEFEFVDYERELLVRGLELIADQAQDEIEQAEAEALAHRIATRGRPLDRMDHEVREIIAGNGASNMRTGRTK